MTANARMDEHGGGTEVVEMSTRTFERTTPSDRGSRCRRRAFSIIDFWWLFLVLILLIAILLPSLSRARQIAKRTVCASNLGGIGMGFKVYANDNDDWYPTAKFTPSKAGPMDNAHEVTFIGQLSRNYTLPSHDAAVVSSQHPSRSLFLLVINGTLTPKQFVCPSSGDVEDDLRIWKGENRRTASTPGVQRFDFRGYDNLSYGYQLPYGNKAQPNENLDPRMPIVADKGPFFEAGKLDATNGETPDKLRDEYSQGAGLKLPERGQAVLQMTNDAWRKFNSRNHAGEGQNVLYQDAHVDFEKKPIVGVNYDNIYTSQSGYELGDSMAGNFPKDKVGPFTTTDSVIVP